MHTPVQWWKAVRKYKKALGKHSHSGLLWWVSIRGMIQYGSQNSNVPPHEDHEEHQRVLHLASTFIQARSGAPPSPPSLASIFFLHNTPSLTSKAWISTTPSLPSDHGRCTTPPQLFPFHGGECTTPPSCAHPRWGGLHHLPPPAVPIQCGGGRTTPPHRHPFKGRDLFCPLQNWFGRGRVGCMKSTVSFMKSRCLCVKMVKTPHIHDSSYDHNKCPFFSLR